MKYTKNDLMPKRYPENKPTKEFVRYWKIGNDTMTSYWWSPLAFGGDRMPSWDAAVDWFIDIPGAPDEVKPLEYPANKPSEAGLYIVHLPDDDEWVTWWYETNTADFLFTSHNHHWQCVDYFIPIRLEPLENTDKAESEKIYPMCKPQSAMIDCRIRDCKYYAGAGKCTTTPAITLNPQDNRFVCWSYIHKEPENEPSSNPCQLESEEEVVWSRNGLRVTVDSEYAFIDDDSLIKNCEPDGILVENAELTAFARHWLELQGYATTIKEPEILPCPNPECGGKCCLEPDKISGKVVWFVGCDDCMYSGPSADSPAEAKRLHNLLADKAG